TISQQVCPLCSSHFVVGVPPTLLPSASTFNYSLLGATSPTFADGSGLPGSFAGNLNIMFGVNPALITGSSGQSFSGNLSGLVVALDGTVTIPNEASYHLLTVGGLSNLNAQITQIGGGSFKGTITGGTVQ